MHGKYASALFVAAAKAKKLDVVGKELEQLDQVIKGNAEFRAFLKDPIITPAVKQKGLEEFFKAAGASDITVNFFGEEQDLQEEFLSNLSRCSSLFRTTPLLIKSGHRVCWFETRGAYKHLCFLCFLAF